MRLVDVDSLYHHLFTCSDGRICPNTDIDNFPIRIDVKTIKKIIREEPIVFDIPDNMTNGDIIKAMFPYGKYNECFADVEMKTEENDTRFKSVFDRDWWDEPYQKGSVNG